MASTSIPANPSPTWRCTINNKEYEFESGKTAATDSAVDNLVKNNAAMAPKEAAPVAKGYVLTANGDNTADFKPLPQGAAVADVTAAPTKEQFNALLAALRTAGVIASK